jgi:radical SAM protein with 4Fe4S-binding SPASM domain
MDNKIIIYGAGNCGQDAYNEFNGNVVCFCDMSKEKIGKMWCSRNIISPNELENYRDCTVVVAIYGDSDKEVEEKLINMGICRVITYRRWKYLRKLHKQHLDTLSNTKDRKFLFIGEHKDECIAIMMSIVLDRMDSKFICLDEVDLSLFERFDGIAIIISELYHLACYEKLRITRDRVCAKYRIMDLYKARRFGHEGELIVEADSNESTEKMWETATILKLAEYNKSVERYISSVADNIPLFKLVEIETYNRCNGVCSFCPVNRNADTREEEYMDEKLFERIIQQLEDIDYCESISLFSNNEPLLDDRIVRFHEYARKHLPKARIHMLTNGLLLTKELFFQLIDNLDELIIDNYNQQLKLIKPVELIVNEIMNNKTLEDKVTIFIRRPFEVLSSRGGNAQNKQTRIDCSSIKCISPYQQIVIRPSGKVSLCCNDPLGRYTMGDLKYEVITDIWYGAEFDEARRNLSQGRGNYGNCRHCDSLHIYN